MPQLVFPFGVEPSRRREDFIVAPCNDQAFRIVERWPDWPARAVALYGPPGCGKTHLVSLWLEKSGAVRFDADAIAATDAPAIAIEDVDSARDLERRDRALMALFESGATLVLTGRAPPAEWPVAFRDLRSRFAALVAFAMWAPDDALLSALVRKHFADRQLQVPDAVAARIVTQVERTPAAIAAFVARADAKALAEKRAVTERLVVELIDAEADV